MTKQSEEEKKWEQDERDYFVDIFFIVVLALFAIYYGRWVESAVFLSTLAVLRALRRILVLLCLESNVE